MGSYIKSLSNLVDKLHEETVRRVCNLDQDWRKPQKPPKPPSRPMKFPYTLSAKVAQFPLRFYLKNSWHWRYYFIALALSTPVFYYLQLLANTEANKKKWAEIRRQEALEKHYR